MAQHLTDDEGGNSPLFNSSLETGVRAVVVLDAAFPRAFDLSQLTWLDHLVVHTADIGGPDSLHPDIPQRTGELLVRRRLVEDGLTLMRRLHLVDTNTAVPLPRRTVSPFRRSNLALDSDWDEKSG
jgi:hypothetical protein